MLWCLRQNNFQRRPHMGPKNMTAVRRAVGLADHDVSMDLRILIFKGDIADEGENFYLFFYRNLLVFFCVPIEIAEHDVAKCTDGCKVTGAKLVLLGKRSQLPNELISFIEYDRKRFLPRLINQFSFHLALSYRVARMTRLIELDPSPNAAWVIFRAHKTKKSFLVRTHLMYVNVIEAGIGK